MNAKKKSIAVSLKNILQIIAQGWRSAKSQAFIERQLHELKKNNFGSDF